MDNKQAASELIKIAKKLNSDDDLKKIIEKKTGLDVAIRKIGPGKKAFRINSPTGMNLFSFIVSNKSYGIAGNFWTVDEKNLQEQFGISKWLEDVNLD